MKWRTLAISVVTFAGLTGAVPAADATFPGAVGKIASAQGIEIATVDPDGSNFEILRIQDMVAFDPAWSPDGNELAFVSSTGPFQAIWVANANGTMPRRVSTMQPGEGAADSAPVWSPDGLKIAFHRHWIDGTGAGQDDIFAVSIDGTGNVNLTNTPNFDEDDPAWSPDGSTIAFVADTDIWAMNADGTGAGPLTQFTIGDPGDPSWSPDGSTIAFTRNPFEGAIWTMAADGSGQAELRPGCSGCEMWDVAWSPDGTKMAFIEDSSGDQFQERIWVMNADASNQAPITNEAGIRLDWGVACTRNCTLPPECDASPDSICGSDDDDVINGTSEPDAIFGVSGNDTLNGKGGGDALDGGSGNDIVSGGGGADRLRGGAGADKLTGGPGRDSLNGGKGRDRCVITKGERTRSCERVVVRRHL